MMVELTRDELLARREELSETLAFVEDPANNPWLLREMIDSVDFLLGE